MKNKYGNYVIIKSLMTAESEDKQTIMQAILRCINSVNVTKYRNRWLQFIEENPLKINTLQPGQTTKPSLFKSNSQGFSDSGESSRKQSDHESDVFISWEDNKADSPSHNANGGNSSRTYEKSYSQFYYQNKNSSQDNTPRDNKEKWGGGQQNSGHQNSGQRKNQNHNNGGNKGYNQKLYVEKNQHYQNKNFYGYS